MIKKLFIFAILTLSGCAAPIEKISSTTSGKPETIIKSDVQTIKNELINYASNFGYNIEGDTPYSISFSRPTNSSEDTLARLRAGNAYSSNERTVSYTFIKTELGIRIIATPTIRARMPGGMINTVELSNMNNYYNVYQEHLNSMKSKLDGK